MVSLVAKGIAAIGKHTCWEIVMAITQREKGTSALAENNGPTLLDVGQVAKMLNCSSRHVYRLSDSGRMPRPLKLGALVRCPRAAVEQWIEHGCPSCR